MNTEFSSIFYEARDSQASVERMAKKGEVSKGSYYDKIDKSGVLDKHMSKKDKVEAMKSTNKIVSGDHSGKDMDNVAKMANAADAIDRHDRRHPDRKIAESGLFGYDLV